MNKKIHLILPLVAMSGCAEFLEDIPFLGTKPVTVVKPMEEVIAPEPARNARTAAEFDTLSEEQRAAATNVQGGQRLGSTVASLGAPTEPGLWLKTGLVSGPQAGFIRVAGQGERVAVELRPSGGETGSGSQISLSAMRLLGVSLTALPTLDVFVK